jgi:hypothetical protein
LTETDDEEETADMSKPPWSSYYGVSSTSSGGMADTTSVLPPADSTCEPLHALYQSRPYTNSPLSVITIDTPPPPPAHSPYAASRVHSSAVTHVGSGDGVMVRPPPAHSNSTPSRASYDIPWVVHRPVESSNGSREHAPLSLTLRRCVPDSATLSISSSSSSSTSPFDAS